MTDNAKNQAQAQMDSIVEMVAALSVDYDRLEELRDARDSLDSAELEELAELEEQAGECVSREDAERRILEDALSVEVRSAWRTLRDNPVDAEFRILLCTGGPAVQIRGELDSYGEPCRAWLEYQDWGTPWITRTNDIGDEMALLEYARCFYFGE